MKKMLFALIALTALASACHEEKQDDSATRVRAGDAQHELDQQKPTPPADPAQPSNQAQ
jgi:nitrous oxide reductase accessory protein NosL